jgi:hypothetical protein
MRRGAVEEHELGERALSNTHSSQAELCNLREVYNHFSSLREKHSVAHLT